MSMPAAPIRISYSGPPVDVDPQQVTSDMWVPVLDYSDPFAGDEQPGEVAARLFEQATQARALVMPDGLCAECYGDDDTEGSGFTIVIRPEHRPAVGITCGWRDVENIARTGRDLRFANDALLVTKALVFMALEMNVALGLCDGLSSEG